MSNAKVGREHTESFSAMYGTVEELVEELGYYDSF